MRSAKTLEEQHGRCWTFDGGPRTLTRVRWLGLDLGRRRIGLALSDSSATLARPWKAIAAGPSASATVDAVLAEVAQLARETLDDTRVDGMVVGLPRRLGGEDNENTKAAREAAALLGARAGVPVHLQDERLTSREAEARLAERERDWRQRKLLVDALAAAIILQDFLDEGASKPGREPSAEQ